MLHLIHGLTREEHIHKSIHLKINVNLYIFLFMKKMSFTIKRSGQNWPEVENCHLEEKHHKSKKEAIHNI